ncbi:type 2 periplasmic-binding domain-containing protein [Pseudobacteroides cellulosolvens]|nr:hypothetical protein [Pseudobacteroides cellulosolvens]
MNIGDDIISPSLDEKTLTFYFPSNGGLEPPGMNAVLEEIQKRTKSELNVKLVFKFLDSYTSEYAYGIKDIAAADDCDAFFYTNQFNISLADLEREGVIMDLSEVFPRYAPKYFSKFSKEELKAVSINDKLLAVPNRLPTAQRKHALVREDLMKKYNISDIKSYSDYESYLKTVKSIETDVIPGMFFDTSIGLFAEANGYAILNKNLGLVYKWNDPNMKIMPWEQTLEFKNSINTIINWFGKGYVQPGDFVDISAPIGEGRFSSIIGATGSDITYNRLLQSKGINLRYKPYSLYKDKPSERSSPLTNALVLNSRTKNAGRIFKFIEWLESSQENYDLFMYGIEGKDYVLNTDEEPVGINSANAYENWTGQSVFSNMEYERTIQNSSDHSMNYYMNEIEKTTKYPPHTGFFPSYQALYSEVGFRQFSYADFEMKMLKGELKSDDVDDFVNLQKQNAIDKIVNDLQSQLNNWKSSNTK